MNENNVRGNPEEKNLDKQPHDIFDIGYIFLSQTIYINASLCVLSDLHTHNRYSRRQISFKIAVKIIPCTA
jgi:hypothetical protein